MVRIYVTSSSSSFIVPIANIASSVRFGFCFKQKTAYEMRISDWSSDVCSSDLGADNEAALEMIGDIEGIEVLPTSIVRRKAFPNAAAEGRAVGEQSPRDAKAIDELAALVSAVFV